MENFKQVKRFENIVRLAVLFLVVLVFISCFSFVKLSRVRKEEEKYNDLIASLTNENKKVNESIDEMTTSYDYYEQQAREKLGMVKGDETYIEFQK